MACELHAVRPTLRLRERQRGLAGRRATDNKRRLAHWTTTSNVTAVRRFLLEPDDPEVCVPAPEQRYRLLRKRATMSMCWLLRSATAVGHDG
jgi:hypothetical protein